MSYDTAQPYIASFVIFRKDNKVAFVLRSNTKWMNGYYGLPSGKVEKKESFSSAALREAKEEVGVTVESNDLKHLLTLHRNESSEVGNEWIDVYFEATKWEGKLRNAEPHIHSELAWFDLNNLPENVVPAVRAGLEAIQANKVYEEWGWEAI